MDSLFLVCAGGFLGASARYLLGKYISSCWKGNFPLGTFLVNICGSFLLGLVVFNPFLIETLSRDMSLGIGVGFLGSFTTFSAFEYETLQLLERGKKTMAFLYVFSSFILGVFAAWITKIINFSNSF
ncbi:MAG: chromosome condensation protein CrcB [Peptococcaceae bacterium BRH_c4a]|nr:MAG: chromosome condensation protein CrcB [Peptococcaceae bacterium BRH_c4a]